MDYLAPLGTTTFRQLDSKSIFVLEAAKALNYVHIKTVMNCFTLSLASIHLQLFQPTSTFLK